MAACFILISFLIYTLHGGGDVNLPEPEGKIYRVIGNIPPSNQVHKPTGSSWKDPFYTLENALKVAKYGDQVWLAGPFTYTPPINNERGNCFEANYNIKIYGGFAGTEESIDNRTKSKKEKEQRKSIISGNIGSPKAAEDNCYHVLTYSVKILIDRVTITGGYADKSVYDNTYFAMDKYGAAMITKGASQATHLTLNDVEFTDNVAINGGALWFMSSSMNTVEVTITNCKFERNRALQGVYEGGYGGAIYLFLLANITVSDTTFSRNKAANRGGAIYQDYGAFIGCARCVFDDNLAGGTYFYSFCALIG